VDDILPPAWLTCNGFSGYVKSFSRLKAAFVRQCQASCPQQGVKTACGESPGGSLTYNACRDCAGTKRIKKAGVSKNSSLCEAAFNLENKLQTYKDLHYLTKPRYRRKAVNFITFIINQKMPFASIFYKNFSIFSFFLNYPLISLFLPSSGLISASICTSCRKYFCESAWSPLL